MPWPVGRSARASVPPRALVVATKLHTSLPPATQAVTDPNDSRNKAVLISTAFFVSFIKLTLCVKVSYGLFTEGPVFITI